MHISNKTSATICYVLFAAYTFWLYLAAQGALYAIDEKFVPTGDAFTYTTFFYHVLNVAHRDFRSALSLVANNNYNWLQDYLILLFSPVLHNERGSLIVINFFCYFLSVLLIFRTALACKLPQFWAFCVALLYAGMPWNFQFRMEFSLTSLMPDPAFVSAYLCATILLCWFIADPFSRVRAVLCGLAFGLAIWSRWNAFVYVMMPLAGAGLIVLVRLKSVKQFPDRKIIINCVMSALICLCVAAIYFAHMYEGIFGYGVGVASSALFDWHRKLLGAEWLLLNMPGLAVSGQWFYPTSAGTPVYSIALTLFGHAIVLYAAVSGFRKVRSTLQDEVLIGALGLIGAATFWLDLLLAVVSFSGYYSDPNIFRDVHSLEPAFIGLVCCALSMTCDLFPRLRIGQLRYLDGWAVYVVVAAVVAYNSTRIVAASFDGAADTAVQAFSGITDRSKECDLDLSGKSYLPNNELRRFALDFREATTTKRTYFFWYGMFNYAIANYYAVQANLAPLSLLPDRSRQDGYVLVATYNPGLLTPEPWFRDFLKYVFAKADYIVIPEQLNGFKKMWPSALVAYRKDIAAALNSPEIAPEYLVSAIIEENSSRILVLKKKAAGSSDEGLDVFPRTWGTPQQVIGREFKGAAVIKQRPLWPVDLGAAPHLLYSYHNFNVVRLGSLFVGVAQDAGPVDIRSALAGATPLPAGKLIVEHDAARLKYKIDFCSAISKPPRQAD